jgi:hypothetical protein
MHEENGNWSLGEDFFDLGHVMRKAKERAEKKGLPCNILEYSRRLIL